MIINPVQKQSIEFVTTARESKGRLLEMIATWEPHSMKPRPHYHPYQDELFVVAEGEMTVLLDGNIHVLRKGDSIEIPANSVHAMWNNSDRKAIMKWKVAPALKTEYFFETGMGLAADGKTGKNGMPGLMQAALLGQRYRKEFRLHQPHYLIQRILFSILTPFAKLAGKKAVYPKYID